MIEDVLQAIATLGDRAPADDLVRSYYDGSHRLAFATDKFRSAFGDLFRALADNLCPAVTDALADRLRVAGFVVEAGPTDQAAQDRLVTDAWALWKHARLERLSGEVHLEALLCGDAYLIVWPDAEGAPTFYANAAASVTASYDPERPGAMTRAAKVWQADDGFGRATLYYPDRLEKYRTLNRLRNGFPSRPNAWVPYQPEGEPWPLANPYGAVPVFHFANNGRLGRAGRSELRDVIPLQDALNKSLADMLVAAEYQALPQRWAIGIEVDTDPDTGLPRPPFIPGADRIWAVASPDAKLGQFDPANLQQFLAVQDALRLEIARVSRTPLHYIQPQAGNPPSGEALRTAEAPFLAKVDDRQAGFGPEWAEAIRFALAIGGAATDGVRLGTLWADAAPHGELSHAQALGAKKLFGVSDAQLQREAGYSQQQIDQMAAERAAQPPSAPVPPALAASNGRGG